MVLKLQKIIVVLVYSLSFSSIGQIYNNGNISTGTLSENGVTAPTGYTWSEVQHNTGNSTVSNATAGFPAYYFNSGTTSYRLADDFVVPAGQTWSISSFDFFGYDGIDVFGNNSPIDVLRIQIYNVNPSIPGATPIYGNMTSNVYNSTNTANAFIYRIYNSAVPAPGQVPNTNSKVWRLRGDLNASLPSGTYWVEFQVHGAQNDYIFFPPVTIPGTRGPVGANAKINVVASTYPLDVLGWNQNIKDVGVPASAPDIAQEIPFLINGSVLTTDDNNYDSFITIAPNPVKNIFNITISNRISVNQFELYDICGRMIKSQEVNSENVEVNIEDLKSGNYILRLKTEQEVISKIIVKE